MHARENLETIPPPAPWHGSRMAVACQALRVGLLCPVRCWPGADSTAGLVLALLPLPPGLPWPVLLLALC